MDIDLAKRTYCRRDLWQSISNYNFSTSVIYPQRIIAELHQVNPDYDIVTTGTLVSGA